MTEHNKYTWQDGLVLIALLPGLIIIFSVLVVSEMIKWIFRKHEEAPSQT